MNATSPVFTQVMSAVHREQLRRCIKRYGFVERTLRLSCREQFLAMAFAQLTYRESLRDIVSCLNARPQLLPRLGFRNPLARSTLADANETRDFRIYADLAQSLMPKARRLYANEPLDVQLNNTAYALDSTVVTVSLGLFPWARFRRGDGGVKIHTQMDLRGSIPTFVYITEQRVNDLNFLDQITPEPDAIYVMDRGYVGLKRLHRLHREGAFFVVRCKDEFRFRRSTSLARIDPRILSDQLGHPSNTAPRRHYPDRLRRIRFYDAESDTHLTLLTNFAEATALDIAVLYRYRWQIELFFRWIKQNLRIRRFYGNSINAVQTQIWVAICVYLIVAITHRELHVPHTLHRTLQILSVTPFEQIPLDTLLTNPNHELGHDDDWKQLILQGF
jgi:hypothetical protein